MRSAYRVIANLLALAIIVQAVAMVFGISGLLTWVGDNNDFTKAVLESEDSDFTGAVGFMIHGINGTIVIPVLALALLIVSFFAKTVRGVAVAATLLVLVILQVVFGILGFSMPIAGALHGLNALILFAGALHAARLTSEPKVVESKEPTAA